MRTWKVVVGSVYQLRYSSKKYPGTARLYQNRHCVVLVVAKGRPLNVLVKLRGGEKIVVPVGNLFHKHSFKNAVPALY
jgi:hypothetical protein